MLGVQESLGQDVSRPGHERVRDVGHASPQSGTLAVASGTLERSEHLPAVVGNAEMEGYGFHRQAFMIPTWTFFEMERIALGISATL